MPPRQRISPGQEELIVAHEQAALLHVRDFEALSEGDIVIERDLHQLNALSLFGAINQKEFLLGHPETLERYGKNAETVRKGVVAQRQELEAAAQGEFYESIRFSESRGRLQAAGQSTDELERQARRQWTIFQARYRSPHRVQERNEYARSLRAEIHDFQSRTNRAAETRPHLNDRERTARQLPKLSSRERLVALQEDPRAGFLPTMNREKTLAMAWLDYLDNPEYPLGVTNQLLEVFNHQRHYRGNSQYGSALQGRTMASILYEVHDYWINAVESLRALEMAEVTLTECLNPTVPLTEDLADSPALPIIVRYRDLAQLRSTGAVSAPVKDPLRTYEDRRAHSDPDKNKTLEDAYTRLALEPAMANYIDAQAQKITIGETRQIIRAVIADQTARAAFWADRLTDLTAAPDSRLLHVKDLARRLVGHSAKITPITQPLSA